MKRPEEISLSREEGEALIARLETGTWTAQDQKVLAQIVRLYFWLLFMLQESKLSLKRFRAMLFGQSAKRRKSDPSHAQREGLATESEPSCSPVPEGAPPESVELAQSA